MTGGTLSKRPRSTKVEPPRTFGERPSRLGNPTGLGQISENIV